VAKVRSEMPADGPLRHALYTEPERRRPTHQHTWLRGPAWGQAGPTGASQGQLAQPTLKPPWLPLPGRCRSPATGYL